MNNRLELTKGRRIALMVGIPLCLLLIGLTAVSEAAEVGQGSYPVRLSLPTRDRAISIGLDAGSLHVVQAVGNRLRLRGIAHYALVRSSVSWRVTSAGVIVESHCHFPNFICSFAYDVGVPAGVPEDFAAGNGDITATGLTNARVTASDGSGNITLTFTKAPDLVSIQDSFGDVTVVLPEGATTYKVSTQAPLGTTSVTVPTNPTSKHAITIVDGSGNIFIMQ